MNKRTILVAAVSMSAAAVIAGTTVASAQPSARANDCTRVATADRTLCRKVQLQHPYGRTFDGKRQGAWTDPSGKVLVHRITHGGYTKRQMHDQLAAEASDYQFNVTAVPVSMDAIVQECGDTKGAWAVSFVDADGKPGGTQLTYKRVICN
jgi:hypothetical protein